MAENTSTHVQENPSYELSEEDLVFTRDADGLVQAAGYRIGGGPGILTHSGGLEGGCISKFSDLYAGLVVPAGLLCYQPSRPNSVEHVESSHEQCTTASDELINKLLELVSPGTVAAKPTVTASNNQSTLTTHVHRRRTTSRKQSSYHKNKKSKNKTKRVRSL